MTATKKTTERHWHMRALRKALEAAAPIVGFNTKGRIDFEPEATSAQKMEAQDIINGWDWNAEVDRPATLQEQIDELKAKVQALESKTNANNRN